MVDMEAGSCGCCAKRVDSCAHMALVKRFFKKEEGIWEECGDQPAADTDAAAAVARLSAGGRVVGA